MRDNRLVDEIVELRQAKSRAAAQALYVDALRNFNWHAPLYGKLRQPYYTESLRQLRELAAQVDPEGVLWNKYRPSLSYCAHPRAEKGEL